MVDVDRLSICSSCLAVVVVLFLYIITDPYQQHVDLRNR